MASELLHTTSMAVVATWGLKVMNGPAYNAECTSE